MPIADTDWKKVELMRIRKLGTDDLLDEALSLNGGDGWDGCLSKFGKWSLGALESELRYRLWDAGLIIKLPGIGG